VCAQLLNVVFKSVEAHKEGLKFDYGGDHALARKIAGESIVLLKNESGVLPLKQGGKIAFIGAFAQNPRYQGGGSSHINSSHITGALEEAKQVGLNVVYEQGYDEKGATGEELLVEAESTAKSAETAVVFAGLPEGMEMEGVDRGHIHMPEGHNRLIEAVCKANANVIVVLHNGAPMEMPWVHLPKGILECYLGGQAIGEAVVDVLLGTVNPSGRLPETFPKRVQDNPSYLFFRGEGDRVEYPEKFFMGYRYYISKEVEPLFPFGHGMSYTAFGYADLALDKSEMDDTDLLRVSVRVTNKGDTAGKAVVQLYAAPPRETVIRPVRELKGFEKVAFAPKESKTATFELSYRDFAHWSEAFHDWRVEGGGYLIQICENAHTVSLEQSVKIRATKDLRPIVYSLDMTMSDLLAKSPVGYKILDENIGHFIKGMAAIGYIPAEAISAAEMIGGGTINLAAVETLAAKFDRSVAGGDALNVFMNQPVSMLAGFLSKEKAQEIKRQLEEVNSGGSING
jgi:beta-glucosidase